MNKISEYPIINWLIEVKVDYGIGNSYVGFVKDVAYLILLVIAAFEGINTFFVILLGVGTVGGIILLGRIMRWKGLIQRENAVSTNLNPPVIETLEVVKRIEKLLLKVLKT